MRGTLHGEPVPLMRIITMVRHILVDRFGSKNVSVTRGRGTSYAWIYADIVVRKPEDCICEPGKPYCTFCYLKLDEVCAEGTEWVVSRLKSRGGTLPSFESNGTRIPCFRLTARLEADIACMV